MKRTWAAIVGCSVALLVDAVGLAVKSEPGGSVLTRLSVSAEAFAFSSWLAVLLGLGLASIAALLFPIRGAITADTASDTPGPAPARAGLWQLSPEYTRQDVWCALLPLGSLWLAGLYSAILDFGKRFNNRELSALLLVLLAVASLALALPLGNALARGARALRLRSRGLGLAALGFGVLAVLSLVSLLAFHNKSGFGQLDPWLGLSTLAGLGGYALARLALRTKRLAPEPAGLALGGAPRRALLGPRRLQLGLLAAGALAGIVTALIPWGITSRIARQGGISRYLVLGLRAASDLDRDGYSAFWGGGDCKGLDGAVHPAAIEVPGDGIDNNCLGGDGGDAAGQAPPVWHDPPSAATRSFGGKPPNFLLITIETLRADAVGFSQLDGIAARHSTTPKLDAYAKRSLVFERFFATTPWTRLSLPAILSSRPPSRMGWKAQSAAQRMRALPPETPWAPQLLQQQGYKTIAILNSFRAFTRAESAGFERGFDVYDTSTRLSYTGGTMRGHIGAAQAKLATAQVEQAQGKPFFLWLHLMEPHYLYQRSARAPNFGDGEQELYASEVWEADAVVGEVLEALDRLKLSESTIVTVVGDHGEEFKEHGQRWHGSNLMQPQLHTAALMHVPGVGAARIREAVSHEDLAPTWFGLAGVHRGFDQLRGRNLLPLIAGERLERSHFFLERFEVNDGSGYMAAIVHYPFKLVYTEDGRRLDLYDLERSPDERQSFPREGEAYQALERQLLEHVDGAQR